MSDARAAFSGAAATAVSLLERRQPGTSRIAIDVLVGVARLRHGDMAVLRALARRERDPVQALRVL